jgi:hypothetical protein
MLIVFVENKHKLLYGKQVQYAIIVEFPQFDKATCEEQVVYLSNY